MSFKDFRVLETVGKGSFASVYKVIRKSDNKVYALKRVKINKMSKKEIADALNEIRFLAGVRHKNIVGFLEAFLGILFFKPKMTGKTNRNLLLIMT
jgi:NIMA (never in mitosis gene a)-related kinase 1/4/5